MAGKDNKKQRVKKGSEVVVISGSSRGGSGKVREIIGERVVVEGLQMIKRHTKRSQQNPQGAIVEREGTIHISNLMLEERWKASGRQKSSEEVNKEATPKEEQADDNGNALEEQTVEVEATEEKEDQSSSAEVEKRDDNS